MAAREIRVNLLILLASTRMHDPNNFPTEVPGNLFSCTYCFVLGHIALVWRAVKVMFIWKLYNKWGSTEVHFYVFATSLQISLLSMCVRDGSRKGQKIKSVFNTIFDCL